MAKQLFNSVTNTQLLMLIKRELKNIQIRAIYYDSRSHNTEYAKIFFVYKGVEVTEPIVEIIDNNEFTFDNENGSLSFEFIGNDDIAGFIIFTAIVLRAQQCIDSQGIVIDNLLTDRYVSEKCESMNYLLDKTTAKDKPWDIYTKQGRLLDSYPSLAAVNTALELEAIDVYSIET